MCVWQEYHANRFTSLGTTSSPRHSPGEKRSRRPAVKAVKDGETKAEPQLTWSLAWKTSDVFFLVEGDFFLKYQKINHGNWNKSFWGVSSIFCWDLVFVAGDVFGVLSSACKRCMMIDFEGHPEVWHGTLTIRPWKIGLLLETIIFRFHLKLWGCFFPHLF